jgi:hypothetical protein
MILECEHELNNLINRIPGQRVLMMPVLSSPVIHASQNQLVALYVYTEDNYECLIPFRHTEQIRGYTEHVQRLLAIDNIFVYDKKQWLQIGGNSNVWDVKTLWWYTYNEPYDDTHYHTAAHSFFWRRHANLTHVNSIVPLQQHLQMCQKIRKYAWPMCIHSKLSDSYLHFNRLYPDVFSKIESAGIAVDSSFKVPDLIINNKVYTQYNYHTTTGRPSNSHRGFNFAAMNKEDDTRAAIISRFPNGKLIEFDFDAYHIRLIARLINYDLPDMSIHEYFGKFYFNTDTLTTAQYDQSKQITFRLIYGGIDREFLSIPFFKKTNDFIYSIWNQCKSKQYIKTPILGRHIPITNITGATANKVFNYYLQATETEVSVQKLNAILTALGSYETKLILYTYDSILLDVPSTEVTSIIDNISMILQQGNFPVKIKQGHNYNKMIEINSNIVIA